jgi:RsiW-degrading membrane proteinase PrsW (M82 family)
VVSIKSLILNNIQNECDNSIFFKSKTNQNMNEYAFFSFCGFMIMGAVLQTSFPQFFEFKYGLPYFSQLKKDFWGILGIASIASIVALGAITVIGDFTFGFIFPHYSDLKDYYNRLSKFSLLNLAKVILSKKAGVLILILLLVLFLIGGGHAFVDLDLSLRDHILAYTFGVGLPEELVKVVIGLLLANSYIFKFDDLHKLDGQTLFIYKLKTIGVVATVGLGFGFAEAISSFIDYAKIPNHDEMMNAYLMRTLWCIPLHFSWSLIAGAIATPLFFDFSISNESGWGLFITFFLCCIIPHGLYDALAHHENGYMWIVGILSHILAFLILKNGQEDWKSKALK